MIGDSLINKELKELVNSDKPDYDKIKELVINAYNQENNKQVKLTTKIDEIEQDKIIIWLNKCFENLQINNLFLKQKEVIVPFFSQCISSKINLLSQYHCPICTAEKQFISNIHIRISAVSKQAINSKSKMKKAFEKAIASKFKSSELKYKKGEKLCILIIFVMGNKNRDKDLDNMSKALMDALEGNLFENDIDIDHLNLFKIKWDGAEDYITVNIRKTDVNKHNDVLFKKMAHGWAGAKFLSLENFID